MIQQGGPVAHQVGNTASIAGAFQDFVGNDGDRLGVIELEPALLPPAGEIRGGDDQKLFQVSRAEVHEESARM